MTFDFVLSWDEIFFGNRRGLEINSSEDWRDKSQPSKAELHCNLTCRVQCLKHCHYFNSSPEKKKKSFLSFKKIYFSPLKSKDYCQPCWSICNLCSRWKQCFVYIFGASNWWCVIKQMISTREFNFVYVWGNPTEKKQNLFNFGGINWRLSFRQLRTIYWFG